jgi:hypothetical protein
MAWPPTAHQDVQDEVTRIRGAVGNGALVVAATDAPQVWKNAAAYQCDGTADQVEINTALLAGHVQLSPGTFTQSGPVRVPRLTILRGSGPTTTILQPATSATWTSALGDTSTVGAMVENYDAAAERTTIADLGINGGMYLSCDLRGILQFSNLSTNATDSMHTIDNVRVQYCNRDGITSNGAYCRANVFNRVTVIYCGLTTAGGTSNGWVTGCSDSTFIDCQAGDCNSDGFVMAGGNNRLISCKAWYCDGYGWNITGARCIFSICEAQDNRKHGFLIGNTATLSSCSADSNSYDQSPSGAITGRTYSGFHIAAFYVNLHGIAIDKNEGSRGVRQVYAVELESWVKGNNIQLTAGASFTGLINTGFDATNFIRVVSDTAVFVSEATQYAASLAADVTTTSTTIVDATSMLPTILPGTYFLDAYLIDQSSLTTAGPRFGIGGTATATVLSFTVEQATAANASTTTIGTALNTGYGTNVATAATSFPCTVHARVVVTVGGTLGLRWLMSAAGTGTLKAGSYLMLTRVI